MEPLHEPTSASGHMLRSIAGAAVFGRFGLRAGWSMAIAVLLFLVLNPWTLSRASEPKEIKPGSAMLGETLALGAACIVTLAMALIERRRMAVYGLSRARLRDLFAGAFCGLTALSLLVFTLRACHVLVFDRLALKGPAIYLYGAKWLLVFLLVGLFEEYSTRGFLQYTLTRGMMGIGSRLSPRHARGAAFWIAAAIMSVVFGVLHLGNQGETRSGILMVFCAGLLSGGRARCGGPSASTRPGTGRRAFSTVCPTAAASLPGGSYRRTPRAAACSPVVPTAPKAACSCCPRCCWWPSSSASPHRPARSRRSNRSRDKQVVSG
jgi:membrane protease YdiL (CAAX protease family)